MSHLRRHLYFPVLLDVDADTGGSDHTDACPFYYPTVYDNVWNLIRSHAERGQAGTFIHVGLYMHGRRWITTAATHKHTELMSAIKSFGENHLQLDNVVAARIGRGVRDLPAAQGYAASIVVLWWP